MCSFQRVPKMTRPTYVVQSCSYGIGGGIMATPFLNIFRQRCIQQRLRAHTLHHAQLKFSQHSPAYQS